MRIKKISPTTPANGNIENQYGTSQTNAYSEAYANTTFATKDVATTSANGLMSASDKAKLDNGEVYSTTETKIGTFLGKPLYRKVDNTSVSLTANAWTNLRYKSGEKALVKCIISDCTDFTDDNSCLTYPVIARLYGNYIQIYSFINTTAKCVIVEYTKATD